MTRRAAPPLRVNVGTLALPGVSRTRGQRIAAAFRSELARLLAADVPRLRQAADAGRLGADKLDAGVLKMDRRERPERTGRRLALQVARGLVGDPE
jgi:limonene-1,2-epoxide hydrolase